MPSRIGLYRLGVICLKSLMERTEELCDLFALPADAVLGAARLSVTAARQLFVDNHRGILSYGDEHVQISTSQGKISIYGQSLRLEVLTAKQLLINGKIQRVEWE